MKAIAKILGLVFVVAAAPLAQVACGGNDSNLPPPPPPPGTGIASATASGTASETAAATTPPPPAPPPPTLVLGAESEMPSPTPSVKITAPTEGMSIAKDKAGDFLVKLDVKNWQTAMGSQHVHLILDNKPYKPIYDTKKPVKLSELTGGEALAEGEHVLVAFPSRANHESVKTKSGLAMVSFWVGKKGKSTMDLKKPMLIYSRPKGEYKGLQASHVIVDFQLANDTLATGKDHVDITVLGPGIADKLEAKADKFGPPYFLDNLQDGTYTVKLELLGADDKVVPGAWNSTTRTIKIDREAQPEPMPMPAASGSAAPAPKK
ncbi:MAG TPA: hypothetical protein VGH28_19630 [Polyangiaceae bacterium]